VSGLDERGFYDEKSKRGSQKFTHNPCGETGRILDCTIDCGIAECSILGRTSRG
jgi:hypothetical protein